jgi:hypothetical protein
MDWYESNIEPEIREQVKLLRNNGINTICSCGHKMYVDAEVYCDEDVRTVYNVLIENGYKNFEIEEHWCLHERGFQTRCMTIMFKIV